MKVTIYADILFLINMAANYAILASLSLLFRKRMDKKSVLRILLSSLAGALYSVCQIALHMPVLSNLFLKLLLLLAMVLIAYPFVSYQTLF